jgi:hypothetical protein
MCLYTMLINEPFELCSQMSIIHTQSYAYLNLLTCDKLFNLQNELIEYYNASWIFNHCLSVMHTI